MFDLHGDGFVSVNVSQLNVCRVAHEESTIETCWSQSWGGRRRKEEVERGTRVEGNEGGIEGGGREWS